VATEDAEVQQFYGNG